MKTPGSAPFARITLLLGIACAGTLGACLDTLPNPSLVDDLRILAVQSEPPEVGPGATVALDALVIDPEARAATFAWYACIVVEQGQGFFGGGSETTTSGGGGTPLSSDPYGGSCERRFAAGERFAQSLGTAPTASLTIPADLFADDVALKLAYALPEALTIPAEVKAGFLGIAGINYTVSLIVASDGRRIEAQKRVNVSVPSLLPDNAPNLNPAGLALHVTARADATAAPTTAPAPAAGRCFVANSVAFESGGKYALTPLNIPDPQPKYVVLLAGTTTDAAFDIQTLEETSFYSFFATKGSLKKPISKAPGQPQNQWSFASDDVGPAELWVVLRDGRGGAAWCHEAITIVPPSAPPQSVPEGTGGTP